MRVCVYIYTHSTVEVDQKSSKLDKNRYCSKFMYNVYSQMLTTVSLRLCPYKYKRSWGGGFQRNFKSALQTSATNTDQLFKCWAESSLAAEAIGTKPSNIISLSHIYIWSHYLTHSQSQGRSSSGTDVAWTITAVCCLIIKLDITCTAASGTPQYAPHERGVMIRFIWAAPKELNSSATHYDVESRRHTKT